MYIKRALEDTILEASKEFPVVLVVGPRQVGKTTLLQHIAAEDRLYANLENAENRSLAKRDPHTFLQRYTPPVFIDEVHNAPELLPVIQMFAQESGHGGDFWLSSSQPFSIVTSLKEMLGEKLKLYQLLGLSMAEINGQKSEPFSTDPERIAQKIQTVPHLNSKELFTRIHKGSLPSLYSKQNINTEEFFSYYISSFLQEDVKDIIRSTDEITFLMFMIAIAARTGCPVAYEEIAKDVEISPPTAKKWLAILKTSNIIGLIPPFTHPLLKQTTKPLLHFLDTGLCSYLLNWRSPELLENGPMAEALFESFVYSEIYKSYINAGITPPLYYYRDRKQRKVDMIIASEGTINPILVRASKPSVSETKVLGLLDKFKEGSPHQPEDMKLGSGSVVCMAEELISAGSRNWFVPPWGV